MPQVPYFRPGVDNIYRKFEKTGTQILIGERLLDFPRH